MNFYSFSGFTHSEQNELNEGIESLPRSETAFLSSPIYFGSKNDGLPQELPSTDPCPV